MQEEAIFLILPFLLFYSYLLFIFIMYIPTTVFQAVHFFQLQESYYKQCKLYFISNIILYGLLLNFFTQVSNSGSESQALQKLCFLESLLCSILLFLLSLPIYEISIINLFFIIISFKNLKTKN